MTAPRCKDPFFEYIPDLLLKAAGTRRYGGLRLSYYINRLNYDNSEQFSAIVFSLSDRIHYIAFRGTDDNLIGWKEDFMMSFLDEVQAQRDAVEYTKYIVSNLQGDIYLGGHSKGGNLAVYVAASLEEIQDRIIAVYNNDGPGFQEKFLESENYHNVVSKIHTMLPKSSVVGMLMEHLEDYMVVNSNQKGIMQHNALSWEVLGNHFVYKQVVSKSSIFLNQALRQWLNEISMEERATFVEELFSIIDASGLGTISGISSEKRLAVNAMIKAYSNMSPETKGFMKKLIYKFIDEGQKVVWQSIEGELRIGKQQTEPKLVRKRGKAYIKLQN
ncbi:MAG: hypothetical protein H6Q59_2018 [Firmicutes bacterium]|nr:hypothetical protein [Bacillota bacterium]